MFKKIQKTLQKFVDQEKNTDYLEYKKIEKKWKSEIDKKIQKNAKIIDFTEGELFIKVKKTTWKNELIFIKEELKKNFQTKTIQLKKL
jgi:hypothetical protein